MRGEHIWWLLAGSSLPVVAILSLRAMGFLPDNSPSGEQLSAKHVEHRLQAMEMAAQYEGLRFPVATLRELSTGQPMATTFEDTTCVILLSASSCNPCQVSELSNLEIFFRALETRVVFLALYTQNHKEEARVLRKLSGATFPFFYGSDAALSEINSLGKYPVVLLISRQRIIRSHVPIPFDDDYSRSVLEALFHSFFAH